MSLPFTTHPEQSIWLFPTIKELGCSILYCAQKTENQNCIVNNIHNIRLISQKKRCSFLKNTQSIMKIIKVIKNLPWLGSLVGVMSHIPKKVEGSILGQGTYLGCGFNSPVRVCMEETDRCFSLASICFSLSLPPLLLPLFFL